VCIPAIALVRNRNFITIAATTGGCNDITVENARFGLMRPHVGLMVGLILAVAAAFRIPRSEESVPDGGGYEH
jgi:hypothetical protein